MLEDRPKCKRCGGPLDWWHDPDDGEPHWFCNSPKPLRNDTEFFEAWKNLDGDDVVKLEKQLDV